MTGPLEELEHQIDVLRAEVRRMTAAGDRARARQFRAELRRAEQAWDEALSELERESARSGRGRAAASPLPAGGADEAAPEPAEPGALLPIREQVHQALTLLGVPAAPWLITAVHDAFSSGALVAARLTSLRRDEERSFRAAPHARAYYLCAALTADLLGPARGLLAVSTWPLETRVIGPLSPRVDFLRASIAVAESVRRIPNPGAEAQRLLWRFAVNIPGAQPGARRADPGAVAQAAQAELAVHLDQDRSHRQAAADRARSQLDDTSQLFGSRLRLAKLTEERP